MPDINSGAPPILKEFSTYMETILGRSRGTVNEYYLDLRIFFRFMLQKRGIPSPGTPFEEISIGGVDLPFIASITQSEIYDYLLYISRERAKFHNSSSTTYGNQAVTRSRKVSALRSFFKYLCEKTRQIPQNPMTNIDTPKARKTLPKFLTIEESVQLLDNIDGKYDLRDYCIMTLFLNCGLRVSELAAINNGDFDMHSRSLRVLGKGNKERIVYLNDACIDAISNYLEHGRPSPKDSARNALFISRNGTRLSVMRIKELVKEHLDHAGLSQKHASAHKLRHTAATLMYQNGVDIRTLKELLGHESLDTTAIYTHVINDNLREAADQSPLAKIKNPSKKPQQ